MFTYQRYGPEAGEFRAGHAESSRGYALCALIHTGATGPFFFEQ